MTSRQLLGIAVALLAGLTGATVAHARPPHIYWTYGQGGQIGESLLDGTEVDNALVSGASEPQGIAAYDQDLYWTNFGTGTIGRASLEGKEVEQEFIKGASEPGGVAVAGRYVYWTNFGTGTIGRANLEGKEVDQEFINSPGQVFGVAVSGQHVYWSNRTTKSIGRASLEGKEVEQEFIAGLTEPEGLAVDADHVYWADYIAGTIGRANLEGKEVEKELVRAVGHPDGLAADAQHIYWENQQGDAIGRANLEGGEAARGFIEGDGEITSVAVSTAPSAAIAAPASGGSYTLGQSVPAVFSCTDANGVLGSCVDGNGASAPAGHLDTSALGAHTYTVTATTADGQSASASIAYTVVAPPSSPSQPPAKATAPIRKHALRVNAVTGVITLEYEFPEPGQAVVEGKVLAGASLASVTPCRKGFVQRHGRCVSNAPVRYGRTTLALATAGTHKLVVKPSSKVLAALKKGRTLSVQLALAFVPAGTSERFTESASAHVRLKPRRKLRT